jgi:hypothetical protein
VTVSVPAVNPLAAFTVTFSVANPPEMVAVPKVVGPAVNVTVPGTTPAVEVTDATNVVAPPSVAEGGAAVRVVVVIEGPTTVRYALPVEAA